MLKSYFIIGLRNLRRNKVYSIINVGGLAIGIACFVIIMLYVQHEFAYDKFHERASRIYRVYQKQTGNVFLGTDLFANTPAQLASVLEEEFPEVEYATSVTNQNALLGVGDQHYWEQGLAGGQRFFDMFSFTFVRGNRHTAFQNPKSVVLTSSLAQKIFGDHDPMGQTVTWQNGDALAVTGLVEDPPSTSSLQFSYVVNINSLEWYNSESKRTTWRNNNVHTFFLLKENHRVADVESQFGAMITKYHDPASYAKYPFVDEYFAQPLTEMYLAPGINFDIGLKGNPRYVQLFPIVALIVLLLACVNYMNLAIARSVHRAREVGLRKTVGAFRRQILAQFLGESVLIALVSLFVGLALVYFLLPTFGHIMERPIEMNFFENRWLIPGLVMLVILVGLFSGSYPSLVISALRPVQVLTGTMDGKLSEFRLQRWLIVVQYGVAIVLIVSSLVIYRQIQYMNNKPLGYDRDNILTVQVRDRELMQKYETLATDWRQHAGILAVTSSSQLPTNITSSTVVRDEDGSDASDDLAIYQWDANYNFTDVFGVGLVSGRSFSKNSLDDQKNNVILNETAAKAFGWTSDEAIGKQFVHDGVKTVIGVVRDFHMHSMHLAIQPLMIRLNTGWANYISVKILPGKSREAIAFLEGSLKKYSPFPFDYQFLDDHFNQLYSSEAKLGEIFGFFTLVSILLAALGLFGLAAFSAGRRTKEIGIRKVLGASPQNIVGLLTKDFLGLMVVSFLISIPVAWYAMHQWLQAFAYRTEVSWWIFAIGGGFALVIANLAIGYQSVRASLADPVQSLKTE